MKILACDIGGTNIRFSHCESNQKDLPVIQDTLLLRTNDPKFNSFRDVLDHFEKQQLTPFLALADYDIVALAVAGPVYKNASEPPNIKWKIDAKDIHETQCLIINDFVAQAYAFLLPDIFNRMVIVKTGEINLDGTKAIVGAGTGLGFCILAKSLAPEGGDHWIPVPSEGGHTIFPFLGDRESDFHDFVKIKLAKSYATADNIVSGKGLSLLHEYLTAKIVEPKEITAGIEKNKKTLDFFARFYGRVVREFALTAYATGGIILTGGIAAKEPEIVQSPSFLAEFLDSPTHKAVLEKIPIYLNCNENVGLHGVVNYAMTLFKNSLHS